MRRFGDAVRAFRQAGHPHRRVADRPGLSEISVDFAVNCSGACRRGTGVSRNRPPPSADTGAFRGLRSVYRPTRDILRSSGTNRRQFGSFPDSARVPVCSPSRLPVLGEHVRIKGSKFVPQLVFSALRSRNGNW